MARLCLTDTLVYLSGDRYLSDGDSDRREILHDGSLVELCARLSFCPFGGDIFRCLQMSVKMASGSDDSKDFSPRTMTRTRTWVPRTRTRTRTSLSRTRTRTRIWVQGPGQGQGLHSQGPGQGPGFEYKDQDKDKTWANVFTSGRCQVSKISHVMCVWMQVSQITTL